MQKDDTAKDMVKITFVGVYFSSCRFLTEGKLPIRPEVTIVSTGKKVKLNKKLKYGNWEERVDLETSLYQLL